MKAAVCRRYGPPNVVEIADMPRPIPKAKDVRIKGRATTVTAAPGGRLLLVVGTLGQMIRAMVWPSRGEGRKVLSGVASVRTADLLLLRTLAESGAFKPVIDRTYPLARIVDAHTYVDTGRKRGNVVITVD